MKINFVRLQDFRNIEFAEVKFDSDSIWISGQNAQGKTNLLEALGMLAALRSFRTQTMKALVREKRKQAEILVDVSHEMFGNSQVHLKISDKRAVAVDGNEVKKFADFIGSFPALAMSCDDIKILRGAPEVRRKDIDMFISSIDAPYFEALKKFYATLAQRNALLKLENQDDSLYAPFEKQMSEAAATVSSKRKYWFEKLGNLASSRYAILAKANGEDAAIRMKTPFADFSTEDFLKLFESERKSDLEWRLTRKGPHRDDFIFSVANRDAKLYASEGQQRSAVLALKLAQFEILKDMRRIEPVVLCDNVLGELDSVRRGAFWECLSPTAQVIATSTTPAPSDGVRGNWQTINVKSGKFEI